MAGKFLSLEEAARHLGIPVEEVNRLVDRKQLFPMRDGATVKFKLDDVERAARELQDDAAPTSDLALDLDLDLGGGSGAGDDLVIGDAVDARGSGTAIRGSGALAIGDDDGGLASDDLEIDSIIASAEPVRPGADSSSGTDDSGTLAIDLTDTGLGSGPLGSDAAAVLSDAIDSGLSLEPGSIAGSGIDLGGGPAEIGLGGGSEVGSGSGAMAGGFGTDAFDLGETGAEDEAASVVLSDDDASEPSDSSSSFFTTLDDDSPSSSIEGSGLGPAAARDDEYVVVAPPFTRWQLVGLVCCTLFLLTCGLVMLDLVWMVRAPDGEPVSTPLLQALAGLFSWR